MMNLDAIRRPAVLVPLLLLAGLALAPFAALAADQPFYIVFFARILAYAIAASALNLALGFGGMVSLGHALFLGLGAYSVAIPASHGIDNGWVHLAVCVAACGLVGLLTGAVSLRTTGIGFIMITLAFAQMGYFVFVSLKQYGGDDGTPVTATSRFFGLDLGQPLNVYAVAFAMLCLVLWWSARLRVAPFGMVLRGARQNPRRINAIGLQAKRYQLAAYVMSAILCGMAGMLLANLTAFASPATLGWVVSGDLIVMIVLGGIGTVFGPLLGALAFLGAEELLKSVTESWQAVFGLAIFLIALLRTAGLAGLLERWSLPGGAAPGTTQQDGNLAVQQTVNTAANVAANTVANTVAQTAATTAASTAVRSAGNAADDATANTAVDTVINAAAAVTAGGGA